MSTAAQKRVAFEDRKSIRCSRSCPRLIYDEPYIFQVRSERTGSHLHPCQSCLKEAHRQQASAGKIEYEKRCSRLPPKPVDFQHSHQSKQIPSNRSSNNCNWDNFMKKKSKYAINTPYALCDLTQSHEELENRPAFVNYGGQSSGQKRTFNSLAVHQLKHHEVNEQRFKNLFRERRLRHEAENYFRQMRKPIVPNEDLHSETDEHETTSEH